MLYSSVCRKSRLKLKTFSLLYLCVRIYKDESLASCHYALLTSLCRKPWLKLRSFPCGIWVSTQGFHNQSRDYEIWLYSALINSFYYISFHFGFDLQFWNWILLVTEVRLGFSSCQHGAECSAGNDRGPWGKLPKFRQHRGLRESNWKVLQPLKGTKGPPQSRERTCRLLLLWVGRLFTSSRHIRLSRVRRSWGPEGGQKLQRKRKNRKDGRANRTAATFAAAAGSEVKGKEEAETKIVTMFIRTSALLRIWSKKEIIL